MRKKFLRHPTEPIEVFPEKKISKLTDEMLSIGFQGRTLAQSIDIWAKMLRRGKIVIWMGLAGAMVPAGMRKIISYFIRKRMIDVLVSTGANLYHDVCEAIGVKHFMGSPMVDDIKLRTLRIDRIYDVFADERKYCKADNFIDWEFCTDVLKNNYRYSSREILYLLGKYLDEHVLTKDKNSILVSAYKHGVPVFCPALNDSMIGADILSANRPWKDGSTSKIKKIRGKEKLIEVQSIILDAIKDADETTLINEMAKESGVIYIGGGTPKNFINQAAVMATFMTNHPRNHSFAVQITTDMPQWGGLSGCTFEEAQSWGKFKPNAKKVMCHCDATIALPIISHALSEKFKKLNREVPVFEWGKNSLKMKYKKIIA